MAKLIFLLLILTIFILPAASAQITLPQFKNVYSTGDSIESSFEVMEAQETVGLIKLTLNCDEDTVFYTSPISLKANDLEKITVQSYMLTKEGNCKIDALLEGQSNFVDSASSKGFIISNEINVSLKFNKETLNPGEILRIKGEAKKANGKYVDGTVSIKIGNEGYSTLIKNGAFEFDTEIKENFESGINEVAVEVTDSSKNSGTARKEININAIPTSLEIITNNITFLPEDTLKASAVLYDQSGKEMNTAISLTLYDSWGIDTAKKVTNGSESLEYTFTKDSSTGEWWVYAYAEGIRVRRFISVAEQSKIEVNLNESILNILNAGNVDFKKPIEILFQNGQVSEKEIKELSLGVDGEKALKLNAPDGTYDITVKTDGFEQTFKGISLTGKAVSVGETGNRTFRLIQNLIAVSIIVGLFALAVFLKITRAKNKRIIIGKSFNTHTKKITSRE
jgi:hypothetical protein